MGGRIVAKVTLRYSATAGAGVAQSSLMVRRGIGVVVGLVLLMVMMVGGWRWRRSWRGGMAARMLASLLVWMMVVPACGPSLGGAQADLWRPQQTTYFHTGFGPGPVLMTSEAATVVDERRAEPFGQAIDSYQEGVGVQDAIDYAREPINSLNKPTDARTQWSYHGARWMAPQTARWLTPDPPVKGPDAKFMAAPWKLHPYQYVDQNPVVYWDPDGQCPVKPKYDDPPCAISYNVFADDAADYQRQVEPYRQATVIMKAAIVQPARTAVTLVPGADAAILLIQGDLKGAVKSLALDAAMSVAAFGVVRLADKGYRALVATRALPREVANVSGIVEVGEDVLKRALGAGGRGAGAGRAAGRGTGWRPGPNDLDWRGSGRTARDAIDEAFRRTGVPRDEFEITRWGRDANGKSFPVEWRAEGGAEVNVDVGHANYGPEVPHVGYQSLGSRAGGGAVRGHILLDDVHANR